MPPDPQNQPQEQNAPAEGVSANNDPKLDAQVRDISESRNPVEEGSLGQIITESYEK